MTWAEEHSNSERLAIDAELALRDGDRERALKLYRAAAEAEQRALAQVETAKPRTRGVTAVSCVALWYKTEEYANAEQVAYSIMAEPDVPQFVRNDLRDLILAIWTESSKKKAGVLFLPGQVMVSVKGGEIVTGGAPMEYVIEKVQTIKSIFYRVIEHMQGASYRKGQPSAELQEMCRPWLFQSAPSSYQFSVAVQRPKQMDMFKPDFNPDLVATRFLDILGASAIEDDKALEALVPEEQYQNVFRKLARNLAPTGKVSDRIEIRAPGLSKPVALDSMSRSNINLNLRKKQKPPDSPEETPVELRGVLRAVDLNKDWIDLAVENDVVHITGLMDAVDDVVGPMVNKSVVVQALRSLRGQLKFVDIELES